MAVVTYDLGYETNCVAWSTASATIADNSSTNLNSRIQRLAVSSFITDGPNQVCFLEKNPNTEQLEAVGHCKFNYPPTKLAFAPQSVVAGMEGVEDILVTSSDFLRMWHIKEIPVPPAPASTTVGDNNDDDDEQKKKDEEAAKAKAEEEAAATAAANQKKSQHQAVRTGTGPIAIPAKFKPPVLSQWKRLSVDLKQVFRPSRMANGGSSSANNTTSSSSGTSAATAAAAGGSKLNFNPTTHPHLTDDFCEPVTSFDWNLDKPSMIAATSTDTTICVWDIIQSQLLVQLIAHDRPVYDCSFAPGESVFASCGADGSLRVFDLRQMENCTIVYEEGPAHPMLRVAWSRQSPYIAATIAETSRVVIIDMRNPSTPVCLHANHSAPVNAIAWAPQYGHTLCCVGEDHRALIWDINVEPMTPPSPTMTYEAEGPINGVSWSSACVGGNSSNVGGNRTNRTTASGEGDVVGTSTTTTATGGGGSEEAQLQEWVSITFGTKVSLLLV